MFLPNKISSIRGLAVDSQDDYTFTTQKQAITDKLNAYFDYYSNKLFDADGGTTSVIKLNSENKVLWITDYLSPIPNTFVSAATFDNQDRLLLAAGSNINQMPGIVNFESVGPGYSHHQKLE